MSHPTQTPTSPPHPLHMICHSTLPSSPSCRSGIPFNSYSRRLKASSRQVVVCVVICDLRRRRCLATCPLDGVFRAYRVCTRDLDPRNKKISLPTLALMCQDVLFPKSGMYRYSHKPPYQSEILKEKHEASKKMKVIKKGKRTPPVRKEKYVAFAKK